MDDPVTFVRSMIGISDCSSSLQKACHRIFHQSQKSEEKTSGQKYANGLENTNYFYL
jgi:hypothetical protein